MVRKEIFWNLYIFYLPRCLGFPGGTGGKEPTCQFRRHKRHRFDPWVGKIPWRRKWQFSSCLEKSMDWGAWQTTVYRVTDSWTQLKGLRMHSINLKFQIRVSSEAFKMTDLETPSAAPLLDLAEVGSELLTS